MEHTQLPIDLSYSPLLFPPKNDVRCFRFLLARKAIERLPEVFWNMLVVVVDDPPKVLLLLLLVLVDRLLVLVMVEDSKPRRRFPILVLPRLLLLMLLDCEPCRDEKEKDDRERDDETRDDSEEDRRSNPHFIWLSSSFMLTSSSMRRCWENSWLSPYISSSRCILARLANRLASRSWVLASWSSFSSFGVPEASNEKQQTTMDIVRGSRPQNSRPLLGSEQQQEHPTTTKKKKKRRSPPEWFLPWHPRLPSGSNSTTSNNSTSRRLEDNF